MTNIFEDNDELGKLIVANNEAPLPWGQQQKMVDLFMEFIEERELEHKAEIDKKNKIIQNYEEIKKLKGH